MAVDSRHPLYAEFADDWQLMEDAFRGQRKVKEQGTIYLPPTSGMVADGMNPGQPGFEAYTAYKTRAVFPDATRAAVSAMVGVMHNKPPVIELPASMEPLMEKATNKGESLEMLLRNINEQQLITGRLGLLADTPDGALVGSLPYLAQYNAASIINWDDGTRNQPEVQNLNLVVLDESENVRNSDFEWEWVSKYRVAVLGDPTENEASGGGLYKVGVFDNKEAAFDESQTVAPSLGGRTLDFIPFTFINANDVVPTPDTPPLLGLATLSMTIYRGEADYRQSLFMQGQDTLVVIGATDDEFRVGANSTLLLPVGGDAKFVGVSGDGLGELRMALENDQNRAAAMGAQILDSSGKSAESGDALRIRVAASTATLNQVALAGAFGLQNALRHVARWVGANENEVVVTPNLDFAADEMTGRTLVEFMTARSMGAPYSLKSIHEKMQQKDLTGLTFEEEMTELDREEEAQEQLNTNQGEGPEEEGNTDGQED